MSWREWSNIGVAWPSAARPCWRSRDATCPCLRLGHATHRLFVKHTMSAIKHHWPEYAIEAAGLGLFMLSACVFATLLEHPQSLVRQAIADAHLRRILMGLAMGSTAAALVYSRAGKRSG